MQTNCHKGANRAVSPAARSARSSLSVGFAGLFFLSTTGLLYAQQSAPTIDLKTIEQLKRTELPTQARRAVKSRVKVSNAKLRDAINAYRTDKNQVAQQMLDELLVDSSLAPSDRGVAEFFMGKVLFKEQLYYASVPYFQSVVGSQSGTAYYPYSFQRLIWISKKDGMYPLLVDPLRNRKTGLIPRNYRNDVFYIFARAYFEEGAYGKVEQAIRSIQPSSEFYHEGQLMRALIYLRAGKTEEALGTFIEAAKSPDENVKGLAQLGIARIHYERDNDKLALQNYGLVAQSSRHWLTSQMESAWAHFRSNEPSLALGNVHPFDSEPFSGIFSPEASLIKSTVFFRLCKYSDAERAVLTFFEKYMPIYRQLEAFNARYASNPALYRQEIIKAVFKTKSELPQAVAREIFSENWFDLRIRQLESLKSEADRLTAMQTKYDSESTRLSKRFVNDHMKRVTAEILEAAVPLLKSWEGKLAGFFRQASLLRFESAYATIDFERQKRKTDFIIPNDQQFEIWTFDEEYWRDELGDYRYLLRSECAEDQG